MISRKTKHLIESLWCVIITIIVFPIAIIGALCCLIAIGYRIGYNATCVIIENITG